LVFSSHAEREVPAVCCGQINGIPKVAIQTHLSLCPQCTIDSKESKGWMGLWRCSRKKSSPATKITTQRYKCLTEVG